jgi:hypothetical protein
MTPEEWERCDDPREMLTFFKTRGPLSGRKLRLFGAACCRRRWPLLGDAASRQAVEVAERYAHGLADWKEVRAATRAADQAARMIAQAGAPGGGVARLAAYQAAAAAFRVLDRQALAAADRAASWAAAGGGGEPAAQAVLFRDVFGSPFRPPVPVAPAVLAWHGGAARRLAEAIYEERRFADLPVLADLLEEAGLTDADLLGHLRGPGPHLLGCWALDLLLAKG